MSNASSAANLPSTEVEMLNTWQRVLSSSFIMASSMGLAVVLHDVTTVWGFLGSSAAVSSPEPSP